MDSLYFYFELFAFICCLICYQKLGSNFKILLPFLTFIIAYELANIYNWLIIRHTNSWCNSLEGILELSVYGYLIPSFDKRPSYRKKAYTLVIAGVVFSFVNYFFIQGIWHLNTISFTLQSAIIASLVCMYYYNLLNNDDEHPNLLKHPPFYAATGLLLYSLASFVYYCFFSYMLYRNNFQFYILAKVIPDISSFILYIFLGISFICFSKTKRSF